MITRHIAGIDGLRALAVLVVVAYHYFPSAFPFGYFGVDVFFVISGFVITRLIDQWNYQNPRDFLVLFYIRRIRRLAPALVVCVVLVSLLFLLFTSRPSRELFATGGLSLVGLSNLLLMYLSTDYFALDAHINPFTHTWSLGVEEQFYLIYPLLMLLAGMVGVRSSLSRSNFIIGLVLIGISYAGYGLLTNTDAGSMVAFYLTPFRAWELLLGGLSYYLSAKTFTLPRYIYELLGCALLVMFFVDLANQLLQLTLTVLICAVLLNQVSKQTDTLLNFVLESKLMAFIGNRSYSLYLYHWPFLVLTSLTIGTSLSALAIALAVTVLISSLSFSWIENPFRAKQGSWSNELTLISSVSVLALLSAFTGLYLYKFTESHNGVLASIYGVPNAEPLMSYRCVDQLEVLNRGAQHINVCLNSSSEKPMNKRVIMIGDSHAAQFFPVFSEMMKGSKTSVHYLTSEEPRDFPWSFINDTTEHDEVKELVDSLVTSEDVIVIAFHKGQLNSKRDLHIPLTEQIFQNSKADNFLRHSREWFTSLRERGVHILLIMDSPLLSYVTTIETCYLQKRLFEETSCRVSYEQDLHTRTRQQVVFNSLANEYGTVSVYDPLPVLFANDNEFDPITSDWKYKMVDWNHLSPKYSSVLIPSVSNAMNAIIEN